MDGRVGGLYDEVVESLDGRRNFSEKLLAHFGAKVAAEVLYASVLYPLPHRLQNFLDRSFTQSARSLPLTSRLLTRISILQESLTLHIEPKFAARRLLMTNSHTQTTRFRAVQRVIMPSTMSKLLLKWI